MSNFVILVKIRVFYKLSFTSWVASASSTFSWICFQVWLWDLFFFLLLHSFSHLLLLLLVLFFASFFLFQFFGFPLLQFLLQSLYALVFQWYWIVNCSVLLLTTDCSLLCLLLFFYCSLLSIYIFWKLLILA